MNRRREQWWVPEALEEGSPWCEWNTGGAVHDEVGLGYRERLAGDKEEVQEHLGDSYLELQRQV